MEARTILSDIKFKLMVERLCHHLIETHGNFENTCLIGIQPRGTFLANVIHQRLKEILGRDTLEYGILDVTFYRDDYRTRKSPLAANPTQMDFIIEGKHVVLIDDVLFTGRTIRSALSALSHYGRPKDIELLVLVDRRFNRHLPVQADYVGMTIDAVDQDYIKVVWDKSGESHHVLLYPEKIA